MYRQKAGGLCACPGAEVKWRACSFSSRHTGKYDIREKARQRSAPPGFFCFVSFHIFCVCFGKSFAALSHPEDKKPMVCFLAKRKKQMGTFSNCAPVLTGRKRMRKRKDELCAIRIRLLLSVSHVRLHRTGSSLLGPGFPSSSQSFSSHSCPRSIPGLEMRYVISILSSVTYPYR